MSLPRSVHAVVCDMDGLLVDSEAMFRDVMFEAAAVRGLALPEPVFLRMVGLPAAASRAVTLDHFGADFDYEAWDEEVARLARVRIAAGIPLKPGAVELLDYLEAVGLPRAVATSSGHATVERQLGPSGLAVRFQSVVAGGDYARGKPHPDPFLLAAERLGVAPENCVALEDSHNGVRAAHAAGMMTVMVPDLLSATEEMRKLCVAIVADLHDARAMIARRRAI